LPFLRDQLIKMITPGVYNITVFQDSTWKKFVRLTQGRQRLSEINIVDGVPTFQRVCHKLQVNDQVVFTGDLGEGELCGLELNRVYFVISSGLTADEFRVSSISGGSSLIVSGVQSSLLFAAKPINITGYTIDSDIFTTDSSDRVATFASSVIDAESGSFELALQPKDTRALVVGEYQYDVSLASSGGERYYCLAGSLLLRRTFSRA
jgi:hypothetical protein